MSEESRRPQRTTRRFDSAKLAEATRRAAAPPPPDENALADDSLTDDAPPAPTAEDAAALLVRSRAMTVENPITTQLLAEVARSSQTVDFDEDVIDQAVDKLGDGERPHPHTRRRAR